MRLKKIHTPFHNQNRTLRSRRPTLILVRNGMLAVRTANGTYMAESGDSVLLAPGTFDIEATPAIIHGNIDFEIATFSLAVLGRAFGEASDLEALVLGIPASENTGVYIQKGTTDLVDQELAAIPSEYKNAESIVTRILNTLKASTFQFARFAFFEKRWAFHSLLEANVLRPSAVAWMAANYIHGRAAFFRDCKIFVAMSPAKWVKERRMELAREWLLHGKASVESIAKVLKFCNVRAFRTALWKHFEMTIAELKDMTGIKALGFPHVAYRPFWWPGPLLSEPQTPGRPANESSGQVESPPKPREQAPVDLASDLPHADQSCTKPKPVEERFFNMEMIPVAEIIPFPARLPVLLKAA